MVQMNRFAGRNWDTDVEDKHMDTKGGKRRRGGGDELGDCDWQVYTDVYKMDD